MSIVIKELFESDLDQYNNNWWSSKKIEKLNFNFDQILISGGGPLGPTGFPGDQGLDGAKGITGPQGEIGFQGAIGAQGVDGETIWLKNQNENADHITLKINQFGKYNPANFLFGINKSTDPLNEYNVNKIGILGKIHTHGYTEKNIILSDDESGAVVSLNLFKEDQYNTVLEYGFDDSTDTEFDLVSDNAILTYNLLPSSTSTFGDFKASLFKIKTLNSKFGDTSEVNEIKASTKFNTENPKANWIAQSFDNAGKIKWVDPIKVIPGFPIGSIIGINAEQFNANNFILDQVKSASGDYLQNTNGAGKIDTMYEGWYICNGQTWKSGAIFYELPNLNGYSYDIAEDTSGNSNQDHAVLNSKLAILGGADLKLNITQSGGTYSSNYTNHENTNQTEIFNSIGALSQSNSKLIYICYLKEPNMYWEAAGNVVIPPPSVTLYDINLSYSSNSNSSACSNPTAAYKVDFTTSEWTNLSNSLAGKKIYNASGNSVAVDGIYAKDGIVRIFIGGTFVQVQNCPSINSFTATFAYNMFDLNGESVATNVTLYGNASTFNASTKLYSNPALTAQYYAPTGWYRSGSIRRFWSQSDGIFLGAEIFGDYIYNVLASKSSPSGEVIASASSAFNYCNQVYDNEMFVYTSGDYSFMSSASFVGPVYRNIYSLANNEGYTPIDLVDNNTTYGPIGDVWYRICYDLGVLHGRTKCTGSQNII